MYKIKYLIPKNLEQFFLHNLIFFFESMSTMLILSDNLYEDLIELAYINGDT